MLAQATPVPELQTPWTVVLVLVFLLAASVTVFMLLVRRWTTHRRWVELSEWAQERRFKLRRPGEAPLPEPLSLLDAPRMGASLSDGDSTLLEMRTGVTPTGQAPDLGPRWHLVVREVETEWPPTGLRPAAHRASFLDLYSLSSFPSLGETDRFVIFGTDARAARVLSRSKAQGLLPPDVGLLLHGKYLILDFSSRPFHPTEFGRMHALAEQLASHLPMHSDAGTLA